jgi:hypothetical protein
VSALRTPAATGDISVPTQQRCGRHDQALATVAREKLRKSRDQRPVCPINASTPRSPPQHRDLVAKDHELRLSREIAATACKDPKHSAEGKVEEPKGHHGILTNSHDARSRAKIEYWHPSGCRRGRRSAR